MFVDFAKVKVRAGRGGNGIVSFRHEKFIARGGPDGGDGGQGGDVVFLASNSENTLAQFRHQKELIAPSGESGSKRRKHGKSGEDLIIKVPVGTVVLDEKNTVLADLTEENQRAIIAKGGEGGFGNAHFKSSTRQAPRVAEKGETGEELLATLELKMIADVGLVGLPNAGKSTLLGAISNARPEVADYPFTTLVPHLGVADLGRSTSLLFADIPGLIEGASEGKGLGDEFLRHLERTKVLVHLIDCYVKDIAEAYTTIQKELKSYKVDLTRRPQIVGITKTEGLDDDTIEQLVNELKKVVPKMVPIIAISSKSGKNIKELLSRVHQISSKNNARISSKKSRSKIPTITISADDDSFKIRKIKGRFIVRGPKIERFASRTEFNNFHGLQRLRDIMRRSGILHELERKKIKPGDKIQIGDDETQEMEF